MAKKQTSVRKREREALKRQRAQAKARKAEEKRERRHNKPVAPPTTFVMRPPDVTDESSAT